MQKLELYLKTK